MRLFILGILLCTLESISILSQVKPVLLAETLEYTNCNSADGWDILFISV